MTNNDLQSASGSRAGDRASLLALIAREAFKAFSANRDLGSAATLAYYGFLSLMPLLLLLVFLLGLVMRSSEAVLANMNDLVGRLFPDFSRAILEDLLKLAQQRVWGLASVVILLWSVTPFAGALRNTMAGIFKSERKLHVLKAKLLDLAAVFAVLALFVFLAAARIIDFARIFGPVLQWKALYLAGRLAGTVALAVALLGFFFVVFAPVRLRWTQLLAGALATAILLAGIRPFFDLILRFNPNYGYAFGSLKTLFLLLVWVYYTFAAVLFGAEVIAAARRKEALLLRRLFMGQPVGGGMPGRLLARFTRTCDGDELLFKEGDLGNEMYYVVSGSVALARGGLELAVMGAGRYFGEMSMLLSVPRTATARISAPDTQLIVISQNNFETILRENPAIVQTILKEMAQRLQATDERLSP